MKEFINIILEGMQPVYFWVYYFMSFLGMVTYLVIDLWNRNVVSERTPVRFDWKFWIKDNYLRVILTLFLSPIVIILFQEIIGTGITMIGAFTVGLSMDVVISQIKKLRNRWNVKANNYGADE
jgi:H+/Cl- antiporter ClcA